MPGLRIAGIDSAGTSEIAIAEVPALPGNGPADPSGSAPDSRTPAIVAAPTVHALPKTMMTGGVPVDPKTRSREPGPSENSRSTTAGPLRAQ